MADGAPHWQVAACVHGLPVHDRTGIPATQAGPDFWAACLSDVAAEGFTAVEISDSWIRVPDLDEAGRRDLAATAQAQGLSIPAVHIQRASVIDPEHGAENLAYHHRAIDAIADLGASVYSTGLHSPLTPAQQDALWFWTAQGPVDPDDAGTRRLAVARLRELGEHAAQRGLIMSLELYEDTYLGTADSAVRLIEEIALPTVGLNPDVGNLVRLHRPVEDWLELYRRTLPYANYWHAKNYSRDESADRTFATATPSTLMTGYINYRTVFELAAELGYEGVIACEQYGGDSLSVAGENRRYIEHIRSRIQAKRAESWAAVPRDAATELA